MSKVILYTMLPAAAKISFDVDEPGKIKFVAVGGGDGVPPGMQIQSDDQVVAWVAAQSFGVAIVDDGKVTVESALA